MGLSHHDKDCRDGYQLVGDASGREDERLQKAVGVSVKLAIGGGSQPPQRNKPEAGL